MANYWFEKMKNKIAIPFSANVSPHGKISLITIGDLIPDPDNPRKHGRAQISAIAKSIEAFGFNAPILVDKNNKIVAGHGRYEAALLLGIDKVPVVLLDHLTPTQARAYMLADNKLSDRSTWDDNKLAIQLKELSDLVLDFDIEAIGFEPPEIDLRIQSLDTALEDADDRFELATGPVVSRTGDLWLLGSHRLYCGNALDVTSYDALSNGEKASAAITDAPYNVRINGHVSGNGRITHREFAMASGEMTEAEFADFLHQTFQRIIAYCRDGALIYSFMDWRHMAEILAAGRAANLDLLNLCVWAKTNGGMGSLYRSRHELVFVFKNGEDPHINNIQLGRFGRNRSNVWYAPGANSFARNGSKKQLESHPTVKPITLVADAMLDCTRRNDIVIDPYLGSGTTILAAERTGRRCHAIEIDGRYVDTAIRRWERLTKQEAKDINGRTFAQTRSDRGVDQ
ncbi:site-specific DNA-methyltransferase [Bradyrhizobium sp.]|uniref:site-specific DNA-methyltransferase n=1 Tax=Bradyrhizobium sp. TaxID=376 RepID=UPI003C21A86D